MWWLCFIMVVGLSFIGATKLECVRIYCGLIGGGLLAFCGGFITLILSDGDFIWLSLVCFLIAIVCGLLALSLGVIALVLGFNE